MPLLPTLVSLLPFLSKPQRTFLSRFQCTGLGEDQVRSKEGKSAASWDGVAGDAGGPTGGAGGGKDSRFVANTEAENVQFGINPARILYYKTGRTIEERMKFVLT